MSYCPAYQQDAGTDPLWTSGFWDFLEVSTLASTAYFKALPKLLSINGSKAAVEPNRYIMPKYKANIIFLLSLAPVYTVDT